MNNSLNNTTDDPEKLLNIQGPLPISRVLFLESLREQLRQKLELVDVIREAMIGTTLKDIEARDLKQKNMIKPIDKEFGAVNEEQSLGEFEDIFVPYVTPNFCINTIHDSLTNAIVALDRLDGSLSQMGVNISELIDMDPTELMKKVKTYVEKEIG